MRVGHRASVFGADLAFFQPESHLAQQFGFPAGVGDVENGEAVAHMEVFQQLGGLGMGGFIQGGKRFIQKEDPGAGGQGPGEGNSLFFTA